MKPLGWALLASVCWVGNLFGDARIIGTSDAHDWGVLALIFTVFFMFSGEKS